MFYRDANDWLMTQRKRPDGAPGAALAAQAGLTCQLAAGLHVMLPLGQRVLERIKAAVCEEVERAGAVPVSLPMLQPAELWQRTGRFEQYGPEMFRLRNRQRQEFCLAPTHEEAITQIAGELLTSYRRLPFVAYQVGRKFRDELRPRQGLARAREFEMLDAYSFDLDADTSTRSYERMRAAFARGFERLGLDTVTVFADSGQIGGSFSEMFLAPASSGEDGYVLEQARAREAKPGDRDVRSAFEVGHVFQLGERYSLPLGALIAGADGVERPLFGGCYGIGVSRLIPALIEQHHDERGIVWPRAVAPFDAVILALGDSEQVLAEAGALERALREAGFDVLVDARPVSAGVKFNDAALIGIPTRLIVGRGAGEGRIELERRERAERLEITWREARLASLLEA